MFTKRKAVLFFSLLIYTTTVICDGAGVLPYVKDNAKVYFLLSEDQHHPGLWTDLGGRGRADEDTAAKEFAEEGGGIIVIGRKDPYKHRKDIRKKARKKIGKKQGIMRVKSSSPQRGTFIYKTYLMDVTSEVNKAGGKRKTVQRLNDNTKWVKKKIRDMKKSSKAPVRNKAKKYRAYAEKTDFVWVERQDLLNAAHTRGMKIKGKEPRNVLKRNIRNHVKLIQGL